MSKLNLTLDIKEYEELKELCGFLEDRNKRLIKDSNESFSKSYELEKENRDLKLLISALIYKEVLPKGFGVGLDKDNFLDIDYISHGIEVYKEYDVIGIKEKW